MVRRFLKKIYRRLRMREEESIQTIRPDSAAPSVQQKVQEVEPQEEEIEVDLEVEAKEVHRWIAEGKNPIWVDIRQPYELQSGFIPDALLIPMNQLATQVEMFPKDVPIVLYCAAGARSFGMAHFMRERGFDNSWSLIGGVAEWNSHKHPALKVHYALFDEVRYEDKNMIVWEAEKKDEGVFYRLRHPNSLSFLSDIPQDLISK
jgi:rhodanese-related sulfurtransferase